ncbi:WxL domain-containing protein [Latilactobacillus fragifolii]|uniref:WxL domain-containing protein n=1 Tax=Latilactobacillus fragifolii TaxID=2814244 RepID=UPI001ABAF65A|nr:WxL domain-containing protein [Latilactobacillus fragifolii]
MPSKSVQAATQTQQLDAQLLFKNTKTANTQEIFKLTNEDQDSSFTTDMASLDATKFADNKAKGIAPVSDVTKSFAVGLGSTATPVQVAAAKTNEGTGANVFGWNPEDIQLVLPATTSTNNASYSAKLTWTLATGK